MPGGGHGQGGHHVRVPLPSYNMGMLDMGVTLEWAHKYLGNLGGDLSRITIFGDYRSALSSLVFDKNLKWTLSLELIF